MTTMKLYVWEGVLADYTAGLVVALAPNLPSAMDAVQKDIGFGSMETLDIGRPTKVIDVVDRKTPYAVHVWGGG